MYNVTLQHSYIGLVSGLPTWSYFVNVDRNEVAGTDVDNKDAQQFNNMMLNVRGCNTDLTEFKYEPLDLGEKCFCPQNITLTFVHKDT